MKYTITTIFLGIALVFGLFSLSSEKQVDAQACSAGVTPGNVSGYIQTDNFDAIYLSSDSWNEYHPDLPTNETFFVTFDPLATGQGTWSGRGWSPYLGWVDFSGVNADGDYLPGNIVFSELETDEGREQSGNMTPYADISDIRYETDGGLFVGSAFHGTETIENDDGTHDIVVGAGNLDFSTVILASAAPCQETVDVYLNNTPYLYEETCSIDDIEIRWNAINATDCRTGAGLWTSPGSLSDSGTQPSDSVTTTNTPQIFQVICTGEGSDAEITGSAVASCGATAVDPTTGVVIPTYTEV